MSSRTSACFKNDLHQSSYLTVWSPHEVMFLDICWVVVITCLKSSVGQQPNRWAVTTLSWTNFKLKRILWSWCILHACNLWCFSMCQHQHPRYIHSNAFCSNAKWTFQGFTVPVFFKPLQLVEVDRFGALIENKYTRVSSFNQKIIFKVSP